MTLSLSLFILAIVIMALIETLQHHFGVSIFRKLNEKWWNPYISWIRKGEMKQTLFNKYISVIWSDAFHLFKFIFLLLITASIVTYERILGILLDPYLYLLTYGIVFNIFYEKIFKA